MAELIAYILNQDTTHWRLRCKYYDLWQRYEAVRLLAYLSTGALVTVTIGFGIVLRGGF